MLQLSMPTGERSSLLNAHRDDEKRFVMHADEKLTAFLELQSAIRAGSAARHSLAERG